MGYVYRTPTKGDFDRNLSSIIHRGRKLAMAERARTISEFSARGLAQSGPMIGAIASRVDEIHADVVGQTMNTVRDFSERMHASAAEVGTWARGQLENLSAEMLAEIPQVGIPLAHQQVRRQYSAVFQQRVDGALRDIEVGFIGGRSMPVKDADRRAVILRKFYDERHDPKGWTEVPAPPDASEDERIVAANICRQLGQSGLIEWKEHAAAHGVGRITNLGIDFIEGNAPAPIAVTIDKSVTIHGSQNVQIGEGNAQNITLTADHLIAAINSSSATAEEKAQAKSLLQSVISSPLLAKLLGLITGTPSS